METPAHNWTVISLGGSLICPDGVDVAFLKGFKDLISGYAAKGRSFVIITGGGKIARQYQIALSEISTVSATDLDWVGIGALRLNGMLVSKMFGELAHPEVVNNGPDGLNGVTKSIVICGAERPGSSTDLGAVRFAQKVGATKLINLSNIDKVYTADPRTNPEATPIEKISWVEFRKMIPETWEPGLSAPFDPIASKMAEEMRLEVAVMNGKNLENLAAYLDGREFLGTVIS